MAPAVALRHDLQGGARQDAKLPQRPALLRRPRHQPRRRLHQHVGQRGPAACSPCLVDSCKHFCQQGSSSEISLNAGPIHEFKAQAVGDSGRVDRGLRLRLQRRGGLLCRGSWQQIKQLCRLVWRCHRCCHRPCCRWCRLRGCRCSHGKQRGLRRQLLLLLLLAEGGERLLQRRPQLAA